MSRQNSEDAEFWRPLIKQGMKFASQTIVLAADNYAIDIDQPPVLWIDPAGSKDVLLPLATTAKFLFFVIINTADAAENLTVKDVAEAGTITVIGQNEIGVYFCDGATWRGFTGVV